MIVVYGVDVVYLQMILGGSYRDTVNSFVVEAFQISGSGVEGSSAERTGQGQAKNNTTPSRGSRIYVCLQHFTMRVNKEAFQILQACYAFADDQIKLLDTGLLK